MGQLLDLRIDDTAKQKNVNLLIHSLKALPDTIRQDIREIFTNTLARTGIEGQLAFHTHKALPALPIEALHGYQDGHTSDLHI